jgi:hypothetical protein
MLVLWSLAERILAGLLRFGQDDLDLELQLQLQLQRQ